MFIGHQLVEGRDHVQQACITNPGFFYHQFLALSFFPVGGHNLFGAASAAARAIILLFAQQPPLFHQVPHHAH
jgi:hypothetical protein